jgi:hypothetical protein
MNYVIKCIEINIYLLYYIMSLKNKIIVCLLAVIKDLEELTLKPIVDEIVLIDNPIVVNEPGMINVSIIDEKPIPDIVVEEPITKEPLNENILCF